MPDTADPVAAELEAIRERWDKAGSVNLKEGVVPEPGPQPAWLPDVTRLLALVAALLDGHEPEPLYGPVHDDAGRTVCGHDPDLDWDCHFEADGGEWLCRESPAGFACRTCFDTLLDDDSTSWPCQTWCTAYEALTGQKVPDGG
jgi:hypothetical protein